MDPHLLHSSVPRIRRLEDTARRHRVYAPGLCVSQLNPASIGTVVTEERGCSKRFRSRLRLISRGVIKTLGGMEELEKGWVRKAVRRQSRVLHGVILLFSSNLGPLTFTLGRALLRPHNQPTTHVEPQISCSDEVVPGILRGAAVVVVAIFDQVNGHKVFGCLGVRATISSIIELNVEDSRMAD